MYNFKYLLKHRVYSRKWRKKNSHNYTTMENIFPIDKVVVGNMTYGSLNVKTYGNKDEKLIIGNYCSIAGDVTFILSGEHPYNRISTYPFKKYICGYEDDVLTKGPIIIEDDVWIGHKCLILSGVRVGRGSIIAAGSVVTKDIPPYAIFAGGKIVKYRFTKEIISKLQEFDYNKLNDEVIKSNIQLLYSNIDEDLLNNQFFIDICESRVENE